MTSQQAAYRHLNGSVFGLTSGSNTYYRIGNIQQQPSYSISDASTDVLPATTCNAPSTLTSDQGFTRFDCCLDNTYPSCPYYTSGGPLPLSMACIYSYAGYGSPYGTPCEQYYASESPYGVTTSPTGNVFTDFGKPRTTPTVSCYWENWSRYRTKPYDVPITSTLYKGRCDSIHYFTWTMANRDDTLNVLAEREEGDKNIMKSMVAHGIPVGITFGGWTANNEIIHTAIVTQQDSTIQKILSLVDEVGLSDVDLDLEWPGQPNDKPGIFPLSSVPQLKQFMKKLCDQLHTRNATCSMGILGVGTSFVPTDTNDYVTAGVDKFNLFCYDLHGSWESKILQQAAYLDYSTTVTTEFPGYSCRSSISNLIQAGVPSRRISVGLPEYARGAFVDDAGKVTGGFPETSPLMASNERGVDVITSDTQRPSSYQDGDTIVSDPDQPGFFIMSGTRNGKKFILPFANGTTFVHVADQVMSEFSVTSFYSYAVTMSGGATKYLYDHLKTSKRVARAATPVYYAFPSTTTTTGPVSAPGITVWSDIVVTLDTVYSGCYRRTPASRLCFYKRSDFTATPATAVTIMATTNTQCTGLNYQTLLPSTPTDGQIVCSSMQLYTLQQSVCASNTTLPVSQQLFYNIPSSLNTSMNIRTVKSLSNPQLKIRAIKIPATCTSFLQPPTCSEVLCGSDLSCRTKLSASPYFTACSRLDYTAASYQQGIELISNYQSQLMQQQQSLLDVALESGYIPFGSTASIATRERRDLFGIGAIIISAISLGVASGAMVMSVQNAEKLSQLDSRFTSFVSGVNQRIDVLNDNFKQIEQQYNALASTTAAAFVEQAKTNDKLQQQIDSTHNDLIKLAEATTSQLNELRSALQQLALGLNQLSDTVQLNQHFSSSIDAILADQITYTSLLLQTAIKTTATLAQLNTCTLSIKQRSFSGCFPVSASHTPIFVDLRDEAIIFGYIEYKQTNTFSYSSTQAYCNGTDLFVAAPNCFFSVQNTSIYHFQELFTTCPSPPTQYPVKNCPSGTIDLTYTSPKPVSTFTAIPLAQPNPISFNFTTTNLSSLISDLQSIDNTQLLSLASQIDAMKLNLTMLQHLADQKPLPTDNTTVYIILGVVAGLVTLISLIVIICKFCPVKSSYSPLSTSANFEY